MLQSRTRFRTLFLLLRVQLRNPVRKDAGILMRRRNVVERYSFLWEGRQTSGLCGAPRPGGIIAATLDGSSWNGRFVFELQPACWTTRPRSEESKAIGDPDAKDNSVFRVAVSV